MRGFWLSTALLLSGAVVRGKILVPSIGGQPRQRPIYQSDADRFLLMNDDALKVHRSCMNRFKWRIRTVLSESGVAQAKQNAVEKFDRNLRTELQGDSAGSSRHGLIIEGYRDDFIADINAEAAAFTNLQPSLSILYVTSAVSDAIALKNKEVWRKRIKWLLTKITMAAVSLAQKKLKAHYDDQAAEKRLIDVPEFPIL